MTFEQWLAVARAVVEAEHHRRIAELYQELIANWDTVDRLYFLSQADARPSETLRHELAESYGDTMLRFLGDCVYTGVGLAARRSATYGLSVIGRAEENRPTLTARQQT